MTRAEYGREAGSERIVQAGEERDLDINLGAGLIPRDTELQFLTGDRGEIGKDYCACSTRRGAPNSAVAPLNPATRMCVFLGSCCSRLVAYHSILINRTPHLEDHGTGTCSFVLLPLIDRVSAMASY